MRYPPHFPNWGGLEGANACVRGLERSFWRYASAEAIELITADAPRKRTPPKRDEEIVSFINAMTQGLSIEYQAILDGDVYQPVRGVLMKLKRRRNRGCFAGRGGYCTSHA